MKLLEIGFAVLAIAAAAAWLNVWALPRRVADVSTEVSIIILILSSAGFLGIVLMLVGLATIVI